MGPGAIWGVVMSAKMVARAALVLLGLVAVPAYADGDYTIPMSIASGQVLRCNDLPKSIRVRIAGSEVRIGKVCKVQIQADGSFRCAFDPRPYVSAQYAGRVAGEAIEGTFDSVYAPPPPSPGYSCHATFKR
jgi:hypothetical protein